MIRSLVWTTGEIYRGARERGMWPKGEGKVSSALREGQIRSLDEMRFNSDTQDAAPGTSNKRTAFISSQHDAPPCPAMLAPFPQPWPSAWPLPLQRRR